MNVCKTAAGHLKDPAIKKLYTNEREPFEAALLKSRQSSLNTIYYIASLPVATV